MTLFDVVHGDEAVTLDEALTTSASCWTGSPLLARRADRARGRAPGGRWRASWPITAPCAVANLIGLACWPPPMARALAQAPGWPSTTPTVGGGAKIAGASRPWARP